MDKETPFETLSPLAQSIARGLQEALHHAEGNPAQGTRVHTVTFADAKAIREKLGMTQGVFAKTYNIPVHTLRGWEQKQRHPDAAASAYLWSIEKMPKEIAAIQKGYVVTTHLATA
ncbi:MAG: helix-turn-helix domain-containing protein [Holosporales bacterium]|jgi:putative transcriptional regulator